jgi:hypothetical protein
LAFLQNHREVIVAFDFFTAPTLTFQLLYCFFVIEHGRRRILHFNVTRHPSAEWVVQQLRARHHVSEGDGAETEADEHPAQWIRQAKLCGSATRNPSGRPRLPG